MAMKSDKKLIGTADCMIKLLTQNLSRVSSLDGARNPKESALHVEAAINCADLLQANLRELRDRYDKRSTQHPGT